METVIKQIIRLIVYFTIIIIAIIAFETIAFGGSSLNPMVLLTSLVDAVLLIPTQVIDFVTQLFIGLVDGIIAMVWNLANITAIPAPSASSLI